MKNSTNLMPDEYKDYQATKKASTVFVAAFSIIFLGIVAVYLVTNSKINDLRAKQSNMFEQYTGAASDIDQLNKLKEKKKQIVGVAKIAGELIEVVPRSRIIAEIVNCMPDKMTLSGMEIKTKKVTVARLSNVSSIKQQKNKKKAMAPRKQEQQSVIIEGYASNDLEIAEIVTKLKNNMIFTSTEIKYIEDSIIDNAKYRKFNLECVIDNEMIVDGLV
ncbi:Fimbrial assembly protein (PilN) [Poriferisphaera corsica]|uniref:Fimbrial assembly protein (PilN) n=1 Tax=Poriferisphaera corsica TaxID=2528020 RepID=A0A517YUT7_9BACT|nr:PilN domain-containing protein [Poriferisphaera corsica]QDU33975.1 Fimbrial assembly protein (PilN) [Poriferisphaera corsica]